MISPGILHSSSENPSSQKLLQLPVYKYSIVAVLINS